MIVKDSRSPRGRHEIQPRQGDALRGLKAIGDIGDGRSWRQTMASVFIPRARRVYGPTGPMPKVEVLGVCGHIVLTAKPTLALRCSDACRSRAYRERKAARKKEAA